MKERYNMNDDSVMMATVVSTSNRNEAWSKLQSFFLDRSMGVKLTKHVVLNEANEEPWVEKGYNVIASFKNNKGHAQGIKPIIEAFKASDYKWLLLLDSDAFPFRADWFAVCKRMMEMKNRIASSAVRFENFDVFPHPCVFLASKEFFDSDASFDPKTTTNLLGKEVSDVGTGLVRFMHKIIPLIRTNKVNYHPLLGAVYGHMFYHHGAGSRFPKMTRLAVSGMCDHYMRMEDHGDVEGRMLKKLVESPSTYLDVLVNGISL